MSNATEAERVIVKNSVEVKEVQTLKGMPNEWKIAIPWNLPDDFGDMRLSELLKAKYGTTS